MLGVSVQGGTNAGSRIVKQADAWQCQCLEVDPHTDGSRTIWCKWQPGERYACPDCGARRP